ncbi:MAG: type II secretion system protein GspD [Gammaproteobacteria bacterium]|nr:type II secretion system protein GspD [Gammaproteobacteria bacterium]
MNNKDKQGNQALRAITSNNICLMKLALCGVVATIFSSCNLLETKQDNRIPETLSAVLSKDSELIQDDANQQNDALDLTESQTSVKQQIVEIGSGEFTASSKTSNQSYEQGKDGDITLNFQDTDINEFVKVVLSDLLNKNFIIDPAVNGKVTIETGRPITKKELMPILDEVLSINNASIVDAGGLYKITPRAKAVRGNLSPKTDDVGSGYNVRIIPLTYIAAQEMQKILEPFITEGGELRIDRTRNMVILAGTVDELNNLQDTIDIFDVDWLRGMSVGLYPLEHVDPDTLNLELEAILSNADNDSAEGMLGGLIRTVPIKRLNSILLISSTTAALREAELWLHRLDRPGEGMGQHLYVYDVQNAKASELADILGHIFVEGASSSQSPSLAPGTSPIELTENASSSGGQSASALSGNTSSLTVASSESIKIIADDTRNSLVILATTQDYKMVAAAIRKLDIVPLQVLIEASILEVTLNDELNYGVEWFFKNGVGSARRGQGQLDLGESGLSALAPGFSYTIINSASNVSVALNALETESEINVLSSPSLMVLDNQEASINVGDEIPVPSRQSVSNINPNSPTVNEIQFRNTGITLTVTPRVNNSGLVTMDIKQEVSNAIPTTSSTIDAPTIQQRQIESTVAISSGETIVLGGLILDSNTDNESGVPGLSRIPILGKLFGQTNNSSRRTELIVLITPRIVRNNIDAREITDEFRSKLLSLPKI